MRHPFDKYIKIEITTLLIALLLTILMFVYKQVIFLLFAHAFLALSLLSEAIFLFFTNKKVEAMKQALRSLLLLLLLCFIIFTKLSSL